MNKIKNRKIMDKQLEKTSARVNDIIAHAIETEKASKQPNMVKKD